MSIATWKKEFYPVPASRIKTKKRALAHSLRKWKGLTKDNLKKHEIIADRILLRQYGGLSDRDYFALDAESCALCQLYDDDLCVKCPLFAANGGYSCSASTRPSQYAIWVGDQNPKPMIKLIEKAIKENEK
jgi:hypothetical protein